MRKCQGFIIAGIVILCIACSGTSYQELSERHIQELRDTIERQKDALLAGDHEAYGQTCSDEYETTNRMGMIRTKADRLEMLTSGRLKYIRMGDRTNVRIRTYGQVAVERGLVGSTLYELNGKRQETGPKQYTVVWVYQDKQWRQVARQHTALAIQ